MYKYAYILGVLLLSPLFFLIYIKRKDLRNEMLISGVIGGCVAFATAQYFLGYYWIPITLFNLKNGIEDFLFGFFLCSESAAIFSFLFKKHYESYSVLKVFKLNILKMIIVGIMAPLLFIFFENISKLNPIYNSIISITISVVIFLIINKRLMKVSIFTGLFIFGYTMLYYLVFTSLFPGIINTWWNVRAITGLTLLGVPIEEFAWFSLVGMLCSVGYKFAFGLKFTSQRL